MNLSKKMKSCEESDQSSQWPHMIPEILATIAGHSRNDILKLRSVCSPWRNSVPLPEDKKGIISHLLPLKIPVHPKPIKTVGKVPFKADDTFLLTAAAVYLIQPVDNNDSDEPVSGWLLTVDEINPGVLSIRDPLKKTSFGHLPNDFPVQINLLDYRVTQISTTYNLTSIPSYSHRCPILPNVMSASYEKVILLCNNTSILPPSSYFAVVLFGSGKLAAMNLGTLEWKVILDGKGNKIDDIVSHKGQLHGITKRGKAVSFSNDNWAMNLVAPGVHGGLGRRKRLMESSDTLYMVIRDIEVAILQPKCKVYKLDEHKHMWKEMKNLGDQILFVGADECCFISTKYFPNCQGNTTLFHDTSFPHHDEIPLNGRGSTCSEIQLFKNINNHATAAGLISDFPSYASILWPPPSWFKNDESLPSFSVFICVNEVAIAARKVMAHRKKDIYGISQSNEMNLQTTDKSKELAEIEDIQDALDKVSNLLKEMRRRYKRSGPPFRSLNPENIISNSTYIQVHEDSAKLSKILKESMTELTKKLEKK